MQGSSSSSSVPLDSLLAKKLIKGVVNCQNKAKKCYMASEFEPSTNGELDEEFINILNSVCLKQISLQKVATVDDILDWITEKQILSVELTSHRIEEILRLRSSKSLALVLGILLLFLKVVFIMNTKIGGMASIPSGTCPRVSTCAPDGIISPRTRGYYQKWLHFQKFESEIISLLFIP